VPKLAVVVCDADKSATIAMSRGTRMAVDWRNMSF
jgi:hypothetical protein